jgi:hypothetical protein
VTILASILIIAALLALIDAFSLVLRKSLRSVSASAPPSRATNSTCGPVDKRPRAFGALPSLSDPVGALGNPAPDADLSSNADSEREIYGE